MPEPGNVKQLSIKITGGAVTEGVWVRATNGRTGEFQKKQTNSSGEVIFALMDLSSNGTPKGTKSGVNIADVISYQVQGDAFGGGTYTVASLGGKKVTLAVTDRTTSNTIGVSI